MRAVLCCLVLAACAPEIEAYKPLDVKPARALDVLFVLDDSPSRGTYDAMVSQLDVLTSRLADVDGQLPSLHVGVVSTDLGTSSTRDGLPAWALGHCAGFGKGGVLQGYLIDERAPDGGRMRNFASGDLTLELANLTNPAATTPGCEFPQPLEAMRRALDPTINPGFLRTGAMLAVVFLTSEDDCSLAHGGTMLDPADGVLGPATVFRCTQQGVICDPDDPGREGAHQGCRPREGSQLMVDVSEYAAFLAHVKVDPHDVLVSAVAGPRDAFVVRNLGSPVLQPSCQGAGGAAYPAVRIGALVDHFGGALIDGCTQAAAYQRIAGPIVDRQRSCFPALLASDGEDCTVMQVAGGTEIELAKCTDGTAGPCWYAYADAAACVDGDHLGIAIRSTAATPADARIEARCFTP